MGRFARFGTICRIFENLKNTHGGVLLLALLHGCFSRFMNCANGTKSCKACYMTIFIYPQDQNQKYLLKFSFSRGSIVGKIGLIDVYLFKNTSRINPSLHQSFFLAWCVCAGVYVFV